MSAAAESDVPIWDDLLAELAGDDRVTAPLQGFLNLAVPAGVMTATLYLEVPNDLTAGQINKRLRLPIMEALSRIGDEVTSFRVTVNHDMAEQQNLPIPVADFASGRGEPARQTRPSSSPLRSATSPA